MRGFDAATLKALLKSSVEKLDEESVRWSWYWFDVGAGIVDVIAVGVWS